MYAEQVSTLVKQLSGYNEMLVEQVSTLKQQLEDMSVMRSIESSTSVLEDSSGFDFRCGLSKKKEDAACQGCWAVAVAMLEAKRPRLGGSDCGRLEGATTPLYDRFIDSVGAKKPYLEFCKAAVSGKKEGPKHCAAALVRGYKGRGVPGQGGIDEMIGAIAAADTSDVTREDLTTRDGAQALNQLCSGSVGVTCGCTMWPKLARAIGGTGWIVPTALCANKK